MRKSVDGCRVSFASCCEAVVVALRHAHAVTQQLVVLRRRMMDFAVIAVTLVSATVAATAGSSGSVRAWYYDPMYGYGSFVLDQLPGVPYGMPTDLGMCRQVAAGGGHFGAITRDNALRLWGNNDFGQINIPEDFGTASRVALGEYHTVALATDGYVDAWGNNWYGQTNVPYNLGLCSDVAAGSWHSLAIRTNGTVRGWGSNDWGQRSVPSDLGTVTSLAAGRYHSVALQSGGTVRAWGNTAAGVIEANGRTGISKIGAGPRTTLLLRASDGVVEEFGEGSCLGIPNPATDPMGMIRGPISVFASANHVRCGSGGPGGPNGISARLAGAWGGCWEDWGIYGSYVPRFSSGVLSLAASTVGGDSGYDCFLTILNNDCNDNGFSDADDIASGRASDLNGNGTPDSCDVAVGIEEDCDQNGVIDSVQQGQNVMFAVESQQVGPIGYTSPRSVELAAPPYTLGGVQLQVTAFGDFSSSSEYLKLYLNGRWVGEVLTMTADWMAPKNDCSQPTRGWLYIPRDFFNETIKSSGSTSAVFEVVPSIAVNANQCPTGSWVKVSLSYEAAITGDCNANGLLDVCEVAQFPDSDGNHNGIIDACEDYSLVFDCPGDLDGSGGVDTGDISILLMNFGLAMPGDPNDLDASGMVETGDISILLMSYGDCN